MWQAVGIEPQSIIPTISPCPPSWQSSTQRLHLYNKMSHAWTTVAMQSMRWSTHKTTRYIGLALMSYPFFILNTSESLWLSQYTPFATLCRPTQINLGKIIKTPNPCKTEANIQSCWMSIVNQLHHIGLNLLTWFGLHFSSARKSCSL